MWFLMVPVAILVSMFFYMGPMRAEMRKKGYWMGVRMSGPVVAISMLSASIGMFWTASILMNLLDLMAGEDLWLWTFILWAAAAAGFFTALIPNYLLVRLGWKEGEM